MNLFCVSIPDLLEPISLYTCSSIKLCLTLIFPIILCVNKCQVCYCIYIASSNIMDLAKLYGIIQQLFEQKKISFNTTKTCKKGQNCVRYNFKNNYYLTQSRTALFRAFSSHRQPSASLTKLFPSWTRLLAELDKP